MIQCKPFHRRSKGRFRANPGIVLPRVEEVEFNRSIFNQSQFSKHVGLGLITVMWMPIDWHEVTSPGGILTPGRKSKIIGSQIILPGLGTG